MQENNSPWHATLSSLTRKSCSIGVPGAYFFKENTLKKRVSDNIWFPFWIDKWLLGSIRIEFEPAERSIWVDLLCMAAKDDGFIRANEEMPYPMEQLAGFLIVPVDLLRTFIDKAINKNKLTKLDNGTLYVTTWEKYQFTDRYKRMFRKSGTGVPKIGSYIKSNHIKSNHNTTQHTSSSASLPPHKRISFDFEKGEFVGIIEEDWKRWNERYPAIDVKTEIGALAEWLFTNPNKKKSNYARFIANNLSRKQERGGSMVSRLQTRQEREDKRIQEWVDKKE